MCCVESASIAILLECTVDQAMQSQKSAADKKNVISKIETGEWGFATRPPDMRRDCIPIRIVDHHNLLDVREFWLVLFLVTPRLQERTTLSAGACFAGEAPTEMQCSVAT